MRMPEGVRFKAEAGRDPTGNALAGLRRAVTDHLMERMDGSPSDFQALLRGNKTALTEALGPDAVKMLGRIDDDLARTAPQGGAKIPRRGSDAEEFWAALKSGGASPLVAKVLVSAAGAVGGYLVGGVPSGLASAALPVIAAKARQAGMARVQDLLAEAVLNPTGETAKLLVSKMPMPGTAAERTFVERLKRMPLAAGMEQAAHPPTERKARAEAPGFALPSWARRGLLAVSPVSRP